MTIHGVACSSTQPLGEPASEIVAINVPEVVVTRLVGSSLGGPLYYGLHAALGEIDQRLVGADPFGTLKPVNRAFDVSQEVSGIRLPPVPVVFLPFAARIR